MMTRTELMLRRRAMNRRIRQIVVQRRAAVSLSSAGPPAPPEPAGPAPPATAPS
ncbi:MAG: hypothetical protein ACM30G_11905 [Micromonosporaceae bacterium]